MPYSSIDMLPENIKKLPKNRQRQWMEVWNSAYKKAKDEGTSDSDAESSAFAQANGVIKKEMMVDLELTKKVNGVDHPKGDFLVVEKDDEVGTWHLPVYTHGKPDHGLMGAAKAALTSNHEGNPYGGPSKSEALSKLKALYEREKMPWAVEASIGVFYTQLSQMDVDRPFDLMAPGHFRDMYGQKVDINPEDLSLFVENTLEGIEATRADSGDLVGLPIDANNHDKGDAAGWLIGVELQGNRVRGIPRWTDVGRDVISRGVRRMFSPTLDLGQKTILGGSLTNWPATRDAKGKVLLKPIELSSEILVLPEVVDPPTNTEPGGHNMPNVSDMTIEDLTALIKTTVKESVPPPAAPVTPAAAPDLTSLLDLSGLSEEAKAQRKVDLQAQFNLLKQSAELEFRAEMARIAQETHVSELSQTLVGGTTGAPRGLRVSRDELQSHLLKMPVEESQFWGDLLLKTQKEGLIEFQALGSDSQPVGTKELPKEIAAKLDAGELKLTDLSDPILNLGEVKEYNLSKWSAK